MSEEMTSTDVVSLEVAEHEFKRFTDMMALDLDESQMDRDDLKAFRKQKKRIINYIMAGHLVINESGEPTLKKLPRSPKIETELHFKEPGGASFMETDHKERDHDVAKMHAIMGTMTGKQPSIFANVMGADYKVCQALVFLFLD